MTRRCIVLVVLLAVVVLAPRRAEAASGPTVMVGDSITRFSTPALNHALLGREHLVVGIGGINVPDGDVYLVRPALKLRPATLVIELGVNSARDGWTAGDLPPLDRMMKEIAGVRCVAWVTPDALDHSDFDAFAPGSLHHRIGLMRASVAKRLPGNAHLVDWGPIERQHPEWYQHDGLHPNTAGQTAFASFVVSQVGSVCG